MKNWQENLLELVSEDAMSASEVFRRIELAAASLGFEHVAYGIQAPLPLSRPKITLLNNYPSAWQERYSAAGYLMKDPTVAHGRKTQTPCIWSDKLFADSKSLWDEAREHGLRVGWAQSSLDGLGIGGMLTLSRSSEPLSEQELDANQQKMRWLVQVAHVAFSRALRSAPSSQLQGLSHRELEVLKWSGDGKSAQEIADILCISVNTVNFHIKNVVDKLQVANKTAAVVYAAISGYLF